MSNRGFANGKVILLGEHAVVYGIPALAVGIDRGARAWAEKLAAAELTGTPSELHVRGWDIRVRADEKDKDLSRALSALISTMQKSGSWLIEAESDLWPGAGLGCSAAIGVAIARVLDPSVTGEELAERAMAWERVFHGNPSGVDAAVAACGGCVMFQRGQAPGNRAAIQRVHLGASIGLCIGHTGVASGTRAMVDAVAQLHARKEKLVDDAFAAIASLVKNARFAIEAGDSAGLGKLMDLNQMLLSGLFVSSPEIERLCSLARDAGAWGAKLTGAGGGGSVVAVVPHRETASRVLAAWKADGFDGFFTQVATPRVAHASYETTQ